MQKRDDDGKYMTNLSGGEMFYSYYAKKKWKRKKIRKNSVSVGNYL